MPGRLIMRALGVDQVKVKAPHRVVDDEGNPHSDGDQLTVLEATAQQWQRSGFVEQVAREK
jgi:hypothetical protein